MEREDRDGADEQSRAGGCAMNREPLGLENKPSTFSICRCQSLRVSDVEMNIESASHK
jgi:hypothetical protein